MRNYQTASCVFTGLLEYGYWIPCFFCPFIVWFEHDYSELIQAVLRGMSITRLV
jgi:hypothetical protein